MTGFHAKREQKLRASWSQTAQILQSTLNNDFYPYIHSNYTEALTSQNLGLCMCERQGASCGQSSSRKRTSKESKSLRVRKSQSCSVFLRSICWGADFWDFLQVTPNSAAATPTCRGDSSCGAGSPWYLTPKSKPKPKPKPRRATPCFSCHATVRTTTGLAKNYTPNISLN